MSGVSEVSRQPMIRYYFVNGIANTYKDGIDTTNLIREIIENSDAFKADNSLQGRVSVKLHFNNAAPTPRIVFDVVVGFFGLVGVLHSANRETQRKGSVSSRVIGLIGLVAVIGVASDYCLEMQKDKDKIANDLTKKVSKFLKEKRSNLANLILHSQGADVGYRALKSLDASYKGRVRVIALGGMLNIPSVMCSEVANYKFSNDWVSRRSARIAEIKARMNGKREGLVIDLNGKGLNNPHGIHEYLAEDIVETHILQLLEWPT